MTALVLTSPPRPEPGDRQHDYRLAQRLAAYRKRAEMQGDPVPGSRSAMLRRARVVAEAADRVAELDEAAGFEQGELFEEVADE